MLLDAARSPKMHRDCKKDFVVRISHATIILREADEQSLNRTTPEQAFETAERR
ncbi:MAG: hypothetical protein ACU0CC_16345 [Sagittula sp.]|uniref:hypothetical protein n=1 Tax=unclassified Sagittula TaxID=2624628 RepID=UPI0012FE0FEB|nr:MULTISPECIES: hypothetical protein [unclassified Sagittula]WHZ35080.1 hypothetical protein QNI11_20930 [Sagittula sp. MA-2]